MSNKYYHRLAQFLPRTKAKSEHVRDEYDAIQTGFEKLPEPTPESDGFAVPVKVGTGDDPQHAATLDQLTGTEAVTRQNMIGAQQAQSLAETAMGDAQQARDDAAGSASDASGHSHTAKGHADDAAASAQAAQAAAAGDVISKVPSPFTTYSSEDLEARLSYQPCAGGELIAGGRYLIPSTSVVSLPGSPAPGDQLWILPADEWSVPPVLERNGSLIWGRAEDLILNQPLGLTLTFKSALRGWEF